MGQLDVGKTLQCQLRVTIRFFGAAGGREENEPAATKGDAKQGYQSHEQSSRGEGKDGKNSDK